MVTEKNVYMPVTVKMLKTAAGRKSQETFVRTTGLAFPQPLHLL